MNNSYQKKIFGQAGNIFDFFIKSGGLEKESADILKLKKIFFGTLDSALLKENLKFDFSLSNKKNSRFIPLRFTYNGYKEPGIYDKTIKAFETVKKGKVSLADKKILRATDRIRKIGGQMTFGVDWHKEAGPTLKLYIEELAFMSGKTMDRAITPLVKILKTAGPKKAAKYLTGPQNIIAFGIDCRPDGSYFFKPYYVFNDKRELLKQKIFAKYGFEKKLSFFLELLRRESRGFFLMGLRFKEKKLMTIKVYKIYHYNQIRERVGQSLAEVDEVLAGDGLAGSGAVRRSIKRLKKQCDRAGLYLYPVIIGMDFSVESHLNKVDFYFSIR